MNKYKFIQNNKSVNGNFKWELGKWYTHKGELTMCCSGFHCSKGIYQAFSYVQGNILAEVECKGKHLSQKDKEVWEKMRIIKTYKWKKKDSVLFAIYSAYLCLDNFESVYPDNKIPRQAIESAAKWLKSPTKKNKDAAESAESAAWSAAESAARSAVWSAAGSAARSAESAAWSAESAAESAARSAESAAWSAAESAARSAARSAEYKKFDKWMLNHLKDLRVLKEIKKGSYHK